MQSRRDDRAELQKVLADAVKAVTDVDASIVVPASAQTYLLDQIPVTMLGQFQSARGRTRFFGASVHAITTAAATFGESGSVVLDATALASLSLPWPWGED